MNSYVSHDSMHRIDMYINIVYSHDIVRINTCEGWPAGRFGRVTSSTTVNVRKAVFAPFCRNGERLQRLNRSIPVMDSERDSRRNEN